MAQLTAVIVTRDSEFLLGVDVRGAVGQDLSYIELAFSMGYGK